MPQIDEIDVRLPEYAEPYLRPAKYKSLSGGRAGGKSLTFAQIAVLRMADKLCPTIRRARCGSPPAASTR